MRNFVNLHICRFVASLDVTTLVKHSRSKTVDYVVWRASPCVFAARRKNSAYRLLWLPDVHDAFTDLAIADPIMTLKNVVGGTLRCSSWECLVCVARCSLFI